MLTALFFLTEQGEVIMDMQLQQAVPRGLVEEYWAQTFTAALPFEEIPAVTAFHGVVFAHMRRGSVIVLGATCEEGAALVLLEELALIARLLTAYLKELSENTLRGNFSTIYQLLQEMIDFGYPLTTDLATLQELVPPPTLENKVRSLVDTSMLQSGARPAGVAPSSGGRLAPEYHGLARRPPHAHYNQNEMLFDVVELLDYIVDTQGRLVKTSVRGAVELNCRYNGVPEVLLRLSNTELIDDMAFHHCVRLARYESDRAVSCVPPDGKSTLLQYSCKPMTTAPLPPFYVNPQITFCGQRGRFNCMVGLRGGGALGGRVQERQVQRICIQLLLPPHVSAVTVTNCSQGSASFDRARAVLMWTVGNLGLTTPSLGGDFVLAEGDGGSECDTRAPTSAAAMVSFELLNYTVSGVRVHSVQILNESSKTYSGVKYTTKAGNYVVRTV